jgi:hypothetical protein
MVRLRGTNQGWEVVGCVINVKSWRKKFGSPSLRARQVRIGVAKAWAILQLLELEMNK